jgi:hypothetical protein
LLLNLLLNLLADLVLLVRALFFVLVLALGMCGS